MRVGIIQSNYIPWRGYFDFIADVDLFIFHDDLQYTKGDWRNRNKIKTPAGLKWLTVPVKYLKTSQLICETAIDDSQTWHRDHLNRLTAAYSQAPYFSLFIGPFKEILERRLPTLSELNIALCQWILEALEIQVPCKRSMEFHPVGSKTERLMDLLKKVGGDIYLSGPSAEDYLDLDLFRANRIRLEFKSYDYLPYPQREGTFEGAVTVLDLLFNVGPDARKYLKSQTPNRVIIP